MQGDKENGLISASDHSNFISVSKWAFSCVSFCTVSKFFCHRFIFILLFTKMPLTFFFPFLAHDLVHPVPSISLWHTHQLSRSNDIFLSVFWTSADILDSSSQRPVPILMDFKSDSVYVSIIPTVDTHGWVPLHWEENTVHCRNYTSGSLAACHLLGTVPWVIS